MTMKRWSAGFLSVLMSGALVLAGCARDESRRQSFADLAGDGTSDQDEPSTQAVMSAWVYPEGYTDQDLIALANEHGGYGAIYSAAVNAGYINEPASSGDGPSSSDDDNSGGTWGGDDDGGNDDASGGGSQSGGDDGNSGGTWGDEGGQGDDGGTWGDGGGTWGDGGGTWGDDGGTWGEDGGGGGFGSTGLADEYDPDEGITHRDAALTSRMTPYAVTAGIVSQADTPAPGPADLIALGILAYGLYMTSGSQAPATPCEPCPQPDPPQVHNDHSHGNCPGAHWHYFRYNQNPTTCVCYNQRMFGGCCGEGDPEAPC